MLVGCSVPVDKRDVSGLPLVGGELHRLRTGERATFSVDRAFTAEERAERATAAGDVAPDGLVVELVDGVGRWQFVRGRPTFGPALEQGNACAFSRELVTVWVVADDPSLRAELRASVRDVLRELAQPP